MSGAEFNAILAKLRKREIDRDEAGRLLNALKMQQAAPQPQEETQYPNQDSVADFALPQRYGQVAVIGMSGQFPGAPDVETFWHNLVAGVDAIGELPAHYSNSSKKPGAYNQGGFLARRGCFDPLFFNIPPSEAEAMHPHQRLILQESWKALEDAGYNPKSLANAQVGLYIGAEPVAYFHDSFTGSSEAIIASRLSYFLNLKGPALVVNTGCSSSGVAIHLACESLRNSEANMALAGGVFAMLDQGMLGSLSEIGMLSPSARCRSFDASADGTAFSEGVGVVVLKRLEDAIADGDPIYAVIEGSGINQDGTSNGITAPNGVAQEALIADIYRRYRINPEAIGYIEAHGTGTRLGDPVEANALVRAFRQFTDKQQFCAIGSAKAHIGHTSASSGIISFIKVLLSLQHRQLPGLLHFRQLNPLIEFNGSAFYPNTETRDWQAVNGQPLMAALSSFGHSGTNAHLVVREHVLPAGLAKAGTDQPVLVALSAKTLDSLKAYAIKLGAFIAAHRHVRLVDLAYTLQTGREAMPERVVFLVGNSDELIAKLQDFTGGKQAIDHYWTGQVDDDRLPSFAAEKFEGRLTQLAELWVQGYAPDWLALYGEAKPQRMHLPTYAFADEYYWASADEGKADNAPTHLHPLLQQNTSDLAQQRYSSLFTGKEFFFDGHRVQGQKILPGVAYLEMARAAVERAAGHLEPGGRMLTLKNVFWLRPLAVDDQGVTVHIGLYPEDGGAIAYRIYTDSGPGDAVIYSQGVAAFSAARQPAMLDLPYLQATIQHPIAPERCYEIFSHAGVDHGEMFHGIREIRTGHDEVLAKLVLPASMSATEQQFGLHPSLMDSALQAALGMALPDGEENAGQAALPFALEELQILAPCKTELWCWIRRADTAGETLDKLDIDLCDGQGRVCVSIKGFISRVLADSQAEAGELMLAPVWDVLNDYALRCDAALPSPVLLIGGTAAQHDAIRALIPGAKTLDLPADATIQAITDSLNAYQELTHLVWIAPEADADMVRAQEHGVLRVFRIIKALLASGYGEKPLCWTLVTTMAQAVRPGDELDPTHAAVHGLVGSLAKEYPHWTLRLFDLDGLPVGDLFKLVAEPDGNALAYRNGEWYRQVLVPVRQARPCAADQRPPYRYRGVYVVIGGAGGIGAAWSRHLVEHYRAQIIWIGRRAKDADIQAKLDELAALGDAPRYIAADATDLAALRQAYDDIKRDHPAIQGVVHSAIVLKDQGLAGMDEAGFQAGLAAKVDTSVNLAEVFGGEPLDFMLFFSSVVAFGKVAGQSNYAAGSTFKDAFAHKLAQHSPYMVRIMNWGYWGTVGIVASPEYQQRMRRAGLGSITPEEGIAAVNVLLAGSVRQMAMLKTVNPGILKAVDTAQWLAGCPEHYPSLVKALQQALAVRDFPVPAAALDGEADINAIEALLCGMLYEQLQALGLNAGPAFTLAELKNNIGWIDLYDRWFEETIAVLVRAGYLQADYHSLDAPARLDGVRRSRRALQNQHGGERYSVVHSSAAGENDRQAWERQKPDWLANALLKPLVILVEKMLAALPDILMGRVPATQVMFPNSSLELVETIYKGNPLSDYFNDVVGEAVIDFIENRLQHDATARLRILEVGAGTGGTTATVLPKLQRFNGRIAEYCYTDLSEAFLLHARTHYAPGHPYLSTALFDVEKSPAEQGINGGYDLVIATNVLHATKNIRSTLRNVKATLARHGVLVLNEMSVNPVSGHLTFGLLKGWWLSEDPHLRLPGSPALTPAMWREVLADTGFNGVVFPVEHAHRLGNQVIIAESDGIIRQTRQADISVEDEAFTEDFNNVVIPVVAAPISAGVSDETLREKACAYIKSLIADTLKIPAARIDTSKALEKYGIDSILVIQLSNAMGKVFKDISSTLFFEFQTIDALTAHFIAARKPELLELLGLDEAEYRQQPMPEPVMPAYQSQRRFMPELSAEASQAGDKRKHNGIEDIAIIGLAGRYPGAKTVDEFWQNLKAGKNCITEIPAERWDWRQYFHEEKGRNGTMYSKWGGFIDDIDKFDARFFQVSPREAELMDPQERLFLETVYHSIEDAGYTPAALAEAGKVGIFAGVMNSGYSRQPAYASIANRVSYLLDFHGPSMAVDTACSSSLTAIQLALESLYGGTSDCAIAGGVNLIIDPAQYLRLSAMTVLSATDRCKSFGDNADGIVDGEAVGAVVLKPLAKAIADNDRIYGVIKAGMVNAGGKTNGYTVPNPHAQAQLVADALQRGGIDARTVSYIEAHGTGTILGDPIEIAGLSRAFAKYSDDKQYCALGSAKSNIGHCESAAGIAGLTKILLQLKHGMLAPSLHAEVLNPAIDFAATPFSVNRELRAWQAPVIAGKPCPRRAGVSSFGAGGANAHILVEEYTPQPRPALAGLGCSPSGPAVIVLSARNSERLRDAASRLLDFIQHNQPDLADLAYTLQVGRVAMEQRFGAVAGSPGELADKLRGFLGGGDGRQDAGIFAGEIKTDNETLLVFAADEDLQETIDKWLARGKYAKLLSLWVKGLEIDWTKLHGQDKPRRISLPGYPFARERYWLREQAAVNRAAEVLHPLLHSNVSTFDEQRFNTTFTGDEFFLTDHQVQGQKFLPGVAYLEMARAAVEKSLGQFEQQPGEPAMLSLKNIVWVQPIVVADQPVSVFIELFAEADGRIDYQIQTESGGQPVLHSQGSAAYLEVDRRVLDIPDLQAKTGACFSAEQCYAAYRDFGIDYGPAHRGVEAIYAGHDAILAKLSLPNCVADTGGQFVLHPSIMDSALQAAIGFALASGDRDSGPSLPFALDRLDILASCSESMWAWIRHADDSGTLKLDIDACDEQGNVCVSMKGFSARAPGDKAPSIRSESRPTVAMELTLMTPVWNAVPLRERRGLFPDPAARIAVIGATARHKSALQGLYPVAEFFDVSGGNVVLRIAAHEPDHIIWIAPEPGADMIAAQNDGVMQVFHLVKTLLASGYGVRELGWTLVTTQTQAVRNRDAVYPAHASVHGLAGSLAKEYPHWRVRVLDMDAAADWPVAQMFSLPVNARGDALAYRGREWFEQALVTVLPTPATSSPYRQYGVYVVIGGAGGIGTAWSRYMVEHYQAQLIWIGRRPIDDAIRQKLDTLAQLGPAPRYIQADAGDLQALHEAYDDIKRSHQRIHGVIHSAIVLQDQSLANMDEERFRAGLSAKVDTSVCLAEVFQNEALDFAVFFSSAIAFEKVPGQSNYAAGSTFADALARQLAKTWPCPVKLVNWGYWGSVGIVSDAAYQQRMARAGLGSIEPVEGIAALDRLLNSAIDQMVVIKTIKPAEALWTVKEWITAYSDPLASCIEHLEQQCPLIKPIQRTGDVEQMAVLDRCLLRLLAAQLQALGLCESLPEESARRYHWPEFYRRWFNESVRVLTVNGLLRDDGTLCPSVTDLESLWAEWSDIIAQGHPDHKTQWVLLEACLKALPDILKGRRKATEVLFPNSSMALVEGIYKGNAVADLFNDVLGNTVSAYIRQRLARQPDARIRILEIGAGTGGTTAGLLAKLEPFREHIAEYCYTDLSKAFLIHAEKHYAPLAPYLCTAVFDAGKPVAAQGIAANHYDLVIAANVLHATKSIRPTLRNAKALLRNRGVLVLNELSANSLMAHLTFGLLEGWWLYEDDALRIPGCPGLFPDVWRDVLEDEGFGPVLFPAKNLHEFGQQVIVAESDGIVRQQQAAEVDNKRPGLRVLANSAKPVINAASLRDRAVAYLKKVVADTLKMPAEQIDAAQALEVYGMDSILVVQLTNTMHKHFDGITSTLFFDVQTINALADYLLKTRQAAFIKLLGMDRQEPQAFEPVQATAFKPRTKKSRRSAPANEPETNVRDVAIIGLSGRYPKAANINEFWRNLLSGRHCIAEIPEDRWDWRDYFDEEKGRPGSHYSRWGGFIDDVDKFDPLFFQISPRDAERMDPQERLFLETAYASIEDAGYTPATLAASRKVGVFVGVMNSMYSGRAGHWSIANRVSYTLNLQGPSLAVDTACSSSLTALHLALDSLYSGGSECAIAGGVNLVLDPKHYLLLSEMTMVSASDQCRSFGADADGFVDGEGVGAVVLKPLHKAIADNDHIYGVIKGSMLNAGGKTNGYTVPNPHAQTQLIADALQRAGVHPRTVSYVEAHGTGTALGDPIEIAGLTRAFAGAAVDNGFDEADTQYCAIGSVKSNIGHCESAAGIAGLTKVLLQMRHGRLAPSLHAETLNPEIDFDNTPFIVQQQPGDWRRPVLTRNGNAETYPRIAGISSFGAGGANAHVLVEEYIDNTIPAGDDGMPALIVLSARDELRLQQIAANLLDCLDDDLSSANLLDIAYTLQLGRVAMEQRLGFIAESIEDLRAKLQAFLAGSDATIYRGQARRNNETPALFSTDEEMAALLDEWIAQRKYERLPALWVQGFALDWHKLYGEEKPRRVALPSYPFERERYWFSASEPLPRANRSVGNYSRPLSRRQQGWDGLSYVPEWVEQPRRDMPQMPQHRCVLIVASGDAEGLAQALCEQYRDTATTVLQIKPAQQTEQLSASEWCCNVDDAGAFAACLQGSPAIDAVYFISAPELSPLTPDSVAQSRQYHELQCLRLLKVLKEKTVSDAAVDCYLLTLDNDRIAGADVNPYGGGLTGLIYALAQSDHRFLVRNIDLCREDLQDGETRQALAQMILAEPPDDRGELTKLGAGSRFRQVFFRLDWREAGKKRAFKQRGVYVILGGSGTVGRAITRCLIENYQAQVVWIGRTAPTDAALQHKIAAFGEWGIMPDYIQADVTQAQAMRAAVAAIKRNHAVINGAVFSGIVINFDNSLAKTTEAEFNDIFDVKTLGSVNFYTALAEEPLDFLCYFSSGQAYSFSGAANLSAYAAGITFSDSVIQSLQTAAKFPVGTINWGFWQASLAAMPVGGTIGGLESREGFGCFEHFVCALAHRRLSRVLCMKASEAVQGLMVISETECVVVRDDGLSRQALSGGKVGKPSVRLAPDAATLRQTVANRVSACLSDALKIPAEAINPAVAFSDYGMDSVVAVGFVKQIGEGLGISLNAALIFDYTSVNRLAKHLAEQYRDRIRLDGEDAMPDAPAYSGQGPAIDYGWAEKSRRFRAAKYRRLAAPKQAKPADIAIIGMSGQFPGAPDVATFWRNLIEGYDGIAALPEHYRVRDDGATAKRPDNAGYQWGGVLEQRDCFDSLFFNISPREAEAMSPHQRLILQESWKSLEDAGYNPKTLEDTKTGLYIGAEPGAFFGESFTGSSDAIIASRLSYFLNLKGPALVVNTGCSSSAVAIHLACESLRNEESAIALAGGVFAVLDQAMLMSLADIDMLSPSGHCHTFDAAADGTAFAEGVGVVVLKRLADAVADGDPIYGVIEASGINQDGASNGMTAPNGIAQQELISDVYRRYAINPEQIGYIEAHGTGTKLGDPVEANALVRAYRQFTGKTHYCAVGSAKAHIGHTSASAGVIGLIKLLLSLKHRKIPGLLNFKQLNPLIEFAGSAFYVNTETQDWQAVDQQPRKAALSSFGHSGTNAHLVVREWAAEPHVAAQTPCLMVISAKNAERLHDYAEKLLAFVRQGECELADLAYTLQTGREAMEERLAFAAGSVDELAQILADFVAGRQDGAMLRGRVRRVNEVSPTATDDDDTAVASDAWLGQGEPTKLLGLWFKGCSIDWKRLYGKAKPRRIHLPAYPFARESYCAGRTDSAPLVDNIPRQSRWNDLAYLVKWQEQPRAAHSQRIHSVQTVLLVYAESSLHFEQTLYKAYLQNHPDAQLLRICLARQTRQVGAHEWHCDVGDEQALAACLDAYPAIDCVYFMSICEPCAADQSSLPYNDMQMLRLIKWLKAHTASDAFVDVYLLTLDNYQPTGTATNPQGAGLTGLAYALAQSDHRFLLRRLDLSLVDVADAARRQALLNDIFAEPASDRGDVVKLKSGVRYRQHFYKLAPSCLKPAPDKTALRNGGVYVILGGSGSVGNVITRYLLEDYQASVAWIGRSSAADAAVQKKLAVYRRFGERLRYVQADATEPESLQQAVAEIKRHYPVINAAIFSALVFHRECPLPQFTEAEFTEVIDVKTRGSVNFYSAFRDEALDFMCYFSSIQAFSFLSAKDSAAYAAGISFSDAFVQSIQSTSKFPVGSINWGFWADTTTGTALEKRLEQHFGLIADEDGFKFFEAFAGLLRQRVLSQMLCLSVSQSVRDLMACRDDDVISLSRQRADSVIHSLWNGHEQ